jgi:hypothetical protein
MSKPLEPDRLRDIFVVSTSVGPKEPTLIYRSIIKLGLRDFQIVEHNRRGLSEIYNEFLDRFAGQDRIVVLVHSDVMIVDAFIREKLTHAATLFDIIGLVGSSHFDLATPASNYSWPNLPREYLSGAVEHSLPDGSAVWSSYGPWPRKCVALDGLFLAIDMLTIGAHRFDPQFAFDLYDIDFCLAAHTKQLTLGTTNIAAHHASAGNYGNEAYARSFEAFRRKWKAMLAAREGMGKSEG